jgi:hypothetical protein
VQRLVKVHVNVDQTAGCDGAARAWKRQDGVQIELLWGVCGQRQIDRLKKNYSLAQVGAHATLRNQSVLGADVDLVQLAPDGGVWRFWLQGDLALALKTTCGHLAARRCARLAVPAARYLAARLPGTPLVTSVTGIFPPVSGLAGALATLVLLLVGSSRLSNRAKLERFQLDAGHPRLHSADETAVRIRKVSRRRWWAKLFAAIAILFIVSAAMNIARHVPGQAVADVVVAIPFAAVSAVWLRRWHHPLLARERLNIVAGTAGFFRVRRIISIGFSLFLGFLSLLVPLIVLAGWFVAGLSSSEQDLSSILAGLVIAAVAAGYFIDRAAQRLRARNAHEAMERDRSRRRMLYLRNFGDDAQKIPVSRFSRRSAWQRSTAWLNLIGTSRFEEVLTRALARSGPIIAVGQPGSKLRNLFSAIAPTLGAAKASLSNDEWQEWVRNQAVKAGAVVVSATPRQINPGFRWELDTLAREAGHGRIILVFGTGKKSALQQSFAAFTRAVEHYPLFKDLASGWVTDGVLIMVHVPAEGWGAWHGWGATRRTGWTYTAAVGEALAYAHQRETVCVKLWAGCLVRRLSLHSGYGVGPGSA